MLYKLRFMLHNAAQHTETILITLISIFGIQAIHLTEINELLKNVSQLILAVVAVYQIVKTNRKKRRGE